MPDRAAVNAPHEVLLVIDGNTGQNALAQVRAELESARALARELEGALASAEAGTRGRDAAIIGTCTNERPGTVVLDTGFGRRLIAEPEGEPLESPRGTIDGHVRGRGEHVVVADNGPHAREERRVVVWGKSGRLRDRERGGGTHGG